MEFIWGRWNSSSASYEYGSDIELTGSRVAVRAYEWYCILFAAFFFTYLIFLLLSFRENSPKVSHFNYWFKVLGTNLLAVVRLVLEWNQLLKKKAYSYIFQT